LIKSSGRWSPDFGVEVQLLELEININHLYEFMERVFPELAQSQIISKWRFMAQKGLAKRTD